MAVRQFDKARKRNRKHEQDLDKLDERLARLDHTVARISRKLKGQQDLQEMTIRTVVLPRIASAMYKEIFRIGSGREHWEPRLTDERRSQLLARHDQFADFGMRSVEEMRVFVATVSTPRVVVSSRHSNLTHLSGHASFRSATRWPTPCVATTWWWFCRSQHPTSHVSWNAGLS